MSIEWLVMQQAERKGLESPSHPVLLMSRIRLARNLAGYSFPGWAKPAQRQAVYDTCKEAVAAVPQMSSSAHFEVGGLNDMEKQLHDGVTPALVADAAATPVVAPPSTPAWDPGVLPPPAPAPAPAFQAAPEPSPVSPAAAPASAPAVPAPSADRPAQISLFPEQTIR